MKTMLYFRKPDGKLGKVTFDDNAINIGAVKGQAKLKEQIENSLGQKVTSPVLCLIQNK